MRLVGIRGRLSGTSFVLDGRSLTMGRGAGNDVVLATPLASRTHLELRHGQGGWVLHDGGSTNGTSVNGKALGQELPIPYDLTDGDVVLVGDTEAVFKCIL